MRTKINSSVTVARDDGSANHCPRCGSSIPAYPNYSAWCDVCDWNLQPASPNSSFNNRSKLGRDIGAFADDLLFKRVTNAGSRLPRLTVFQTIAILFSFIAIAINGLAIWASVAIGSSGGFSLVASGLLLLLTAWVALPRFDTVPAKRILTDPNAFPMINRIVGRVANALDTEVPQVILTEQFTATYGRVGWRRQPVLGLGHPFLALLNAEETVSLLAHELSHSQDGALTRSLFVRTALQSMRRWQRLFTPTSWFGGSDGVGILHKLRVVATWLLLPIALPFVAIESLIRICCYQDSQRAEYVADASSVQVAGTRHTLSLLRKSYYQHLAALRIGYQRAPSQHKFNQIHEELAAVPDREIDRIWRIAQRQPAQLTGTHPSLPKRIAFLQSLEPQRAVVTISASEFELLQRELAAWPCVIRKRELDWQAELDSAQEESEIPFVPSAAD